MEEHEPDAADERHLVARARARRQAGDEIDRAGDQSARRGHRLGRQPAGRRGRRSSAAASGSGSAIPTPKRIADAMQPHLFADCAPAARPGGGARGPRRRDRGVAAGRLAVAARPQMLSDLAEGDEDEHHRRGVERTTTVSPRRRRAGRRRVARPSPANERDRRQMKNRLIGSRMPLTTWTPTSSEITGTPGMIGDERADHDHRRDDAHEDGRFLAVAAEPLLVAERLRDDVGGGDRQDRGGQQAGAEQADPEQRLGELSGERGQRPGGVGGGGDVRGRRG